MILIAEVGNQHFGSFKKAKELIRVANNSGATLIKMQAGVSSGSMPNEFYKQCLFTVDQYIELMAYAKSIGNTLFFSIFDEAFDSLRVKQSYHKLAAPQVKNGAWSGLWDEENVFVSIPPGHVLEPKPQKAMCMHVTSYGVHDAQLHFMLAYASWLGRPVGLSDHTFDIYNCIQAITLGATVIEKHFTLSRSDKWEGTVFRDTLHAATPRQLEEIAKVMFN